MHATLNYEAVLNVSDYMDADDPVPELAFDNARDDAEGAEKDFLEWAEDKIDPARLGELTLDAQFDEFDSGNWTHAGAHYTVNVDGPTDLITTLQAHLDEEN
jgi:hypothetical protein